MVFHPSAAAVALDDGVRNDDLGGGQVGVFHMVDDLVCRLLTQEEGVDIHGSELRGGQLGIEGIIEGDDGDVIGDPQALLDADPFQRQGENIIADHKGRGPIRAVQKPLQIGQSRGMDTLHLHTVFRFHRQLMQEQGKLIAGTAVGSVEVAVPAADVADASVTQIVKIIRCLPASQQIVVVDADRLPRQVAGLAHDHIQQSMLAQVLHHEILPLGVEQEEAVHPSAAVEGLDGAQELMVVGASDHGAGYAALVADLADSPDGLQVEGIFVGIPIRGRQHDGNGLHRGNHLGLRCSGGQLIAQLRHGSAHLVLSLPADCRVVVAHTGHGGGGDTGQFCHILDRHCHKKPLPFLKRHAKNAPG